jgi:hypothetical protein
MSCAFPEAGAQSVLSIKPYTAVWSSPGFLPTGPTTFLLSDVRNETGRAASFDATGYLRDQLRQRLLKEGFSESSARDSLRIDVSIRLFQEGAMFGRWLGGGAGAAYCVAYAELGKDQAKGAEAVVTSAITHGGVLSAGAEKTVLEDIAAEIVRLLLSGERK